MAIASSDSAATSFLRYFRTVVSAGDRGLARRAHRSTSRKDFLGVTDIVPWSECKSDAHRLDVHNGLLLSALWDAGFDAGLISFDDDGRPLCSLALTPSAPEYVPEGLLGVTVIDPACGSGHSLLAAARR